MYKIDYDSFIRINDNIYWVGNKNSIPLHTNPYLLVDNDFSFSILFDPGGVNDFSVVTQKILNIIDLSSIKYIVLHHEDPDVCGMTHFLEEMIGEDLKILANNYSELFLKNYGIESKLISIGQNPVVKLGDFTLEFIRTPFLHSPGAFMTYVRELKTLFSSDLFGWIGNKPTDIFSESVLDCDYISWHKQIVPTLSILKPVIEKVRMLEVEIIASQHGGIIQGEKNINYLLNLLESVDYDFNLK